MKKKQEPAKNNSNGSMFIWPVKGEIIKKYKKSCANLDLYVLDAAKIIKNYNTLGTNLNDLNNTLNKIYVQHNKKNEHKRIGKLFMINAENPVVCLPLSCNNIKGIFAFKTLKTDTKVGYSLTISPIYFV